MKTIYLSLGSNRGDRARNLRAALAALEHGGIVVRRVSSFYETAPLGVAGQPLFLNLAVEAASALLPRQLLSRTLRIERELGRRRAVAQSPRTIDIGILFYGSSVIRTPELAVPHPRLAARRFVLQPLAEIAAGLRHPLTKRTVRQMLARLAPQKTRKVHPAA